MAGGGASRVPERWTDYVALGRRLPGTRFIAFKVPLKKSFDQKLPPEERFSPRDLIKRIKEQKEELGLIIDLTYTTRYYRPEELPATLCYSKILTMGHEIPNKQTIFQFKCVVKRFLRDNEDNDKLIGVHCTHGLNRTGYLVCRYLIDVEGMEPNAAIELFNRARGHPIERINYIEDLQKRAVKTTYGLNTFGLGPFREKAGAAPKAEKQMARYHPHHLTHPPSVLPRLHPPREGWQESSDHRAPGSSRRIHRRGPREPPRPCALGRSCQLVAPPAPRRRALGFPPAPPQPCPPQRAPRARQRRHRRKKPPVTP